jgi:hypothetical protein
MHKKLNPNQKFWFTQFVVQVHHKDHNIWKWWITRCLQVTNVHIFNATHPITMGDNTLTIIELILPKSLEKVHDFAMLSLFVDNNTKQWLKKRSKHLGTIKFNLKTYNGKPTHTKPNPTSKTKTSYKHLHGVHLFFQMQCKSKKKNTKSENDILLTLVVISVFNFTCLNLESIHVLFFCQKN